MSVRFRLRAVPSVVVSWLAAAPSWAQTAPASDDATATSTQTVIISATRSERRLNDLPLSATVISRDAITMAPGRSIDDLLRGVPSVQLPADNADTLFPLIPSIAIRGLGVGDTATRALVLADGIPLNGAFFGNVLWNRVPKSLTDRVEVVRGGSSNLYGSFAMGGVVNLVTQVPAAREASADVIAGQQGRREGNARFGDALADRGVAYSLNLDAYDNDGYNALLEPVPVEVPLAGRLANLQGRVDFGLGSTAKGFVRAGYNDQRRTGSYQLQHADATVGDLAGGVDIALGGAGSLALRAFYVREQFDIANVSVPDPQTSFVSNQHDIDSHDTGLSAAWTQTFRGVLRRLTAGADLRYIDGGDDQQVFNAPATPVASQIRGEGRQTSLGVFGEVSLAPVDAVEILAGLRVDSFKDHGGRIVTDGVAQQFADRTLHIASPRLAASWQFSEMALVRGSVYQGFRAPTLAERYRSFETPTFRGLSNPALDEERLTGGDIGVDARIGAVSLQVSAFHNRLKNFVGSVEDDSFTDKFTVRNANVAEVRSRGLELAGAVPLGSAVSLTGSYTYTDAAVVEGPLTGNKVEGTPRHAAQLALLARLGSGWTIYPRVRYVGETYQDITNEAKQDARTLLDLRLAYRVNQHIELSLIGENVLDEHYIADAFGGLRGSPRRFSLGLRLDL